MEIFVGTSGWYYEWNEDKTLDWYLAHSGLNTVELNASFYRFPFPNQIKAWSIKGKDRLRFAIKVHRRITHWGKFNKSALDLWSRFYQLFTPLHHLIDFYLFQTPPSFTPQSAPALEKFFQKIKLGAKVALEFRHPDWFSRMKKPEKNHIPMDIGMLDQRRQVHSGQKQWINWARDLGITLVSLDAPASDLPRDIYKTTESVYLRFHGRTGWYNHNYTSKELKEVASRILAARPKQVYAYFNNNHNMLNNAQTFYRLLNSPYKGKKSSFRS